MKKVGSPDFTSTRMVKTARIARFRARVPRPSGKPSVTLTIAATPPRATVIQPPPRDLWTASRPSWSVPQEIAARQRHSGVPCAKVHAVVGKARGDQRRDEAEQCDTEAVRQIEAKPRQEEAATIINPLRGGDKMFATTLRTEIRRTTPWTTLRSQVSHSTDAEHALHQEGAGGEPDEAQEEQRPQLPEQGAGEEPMEIRQSGRHRIGEEAHARIAEMVLGKPPADQCEIGGEGQPDA